MCIGSFARADYPEKRIVFERGAVEASVQGQLATMHDELRFVVRARSGQHMRVWVEADGPVRGIVRSPGGAEDGSPGTEFYDDVLPANGDYRIRITESPMAEEWAGKVTLHVRIK